MERRNYTREFKLETVNMMKGRVVSPAQAARDLDIRHTVLRRCVKEFGADPQHAFQNRGQMKPEQLEINRLSKEAVRLKAEREIPKKAAVGSTGQCNMIYFIRLPEAYKGKNRSTRFITATEKGTHCEHHLLRCAIVAVEGPIQTLTVKMFIQFGI